MGTRRFWKGVLSMVSTECGREEVTIGTRRVRKGVGGCGIKGWGRGVVTIGTRRVRKGVFSLGPPSPPLSMQNFYDMTAALFYKTYEYILKKDILKKTMERYCVCHKVSRASLAVLFFS